MIEHQLEQMEREEAQWEVSIYDVVQTQVYKDWAVNNVRGMKTEVVESLINDPTNIHAAFVRPPRDIMDKALSICGLDLQESVERQVCPHKTFSGVTVQGERYVGKQRKDKAWTDYVKRVVGDC